MARDKKATSKKSTLKGPASQGAVGRNKSSHSTRSKTQASNRAASQVVPRSATSGPGKKAVPKSAASGDAFEIGRSGLRGSSPAGVDVFIREFKPDRGLALIEFKQERFRYTREKSPAQLIAIADYLRARRGFSSDQEMAEALNVHRTRLAAWKKGTELPNPENAQLLSHLAVVVAELKEFLDSDVIPDWLVTEQFTLGGRTPVDALREGQLAEVLHAANATEHGAHI